jgi:hypothetical protein
MFSLSDDYLKSFYGLPYYDSIPFLLFDFIQKFPARNSSKPEEAVAEAKFHGPSYFI